MGKKSNNLFVTSKKRNHEFKVLQKARDLFKPLYNGVLFITIDLADLYKNIFYFKGFKRHFAGL